MHLGCVVDAASCQTNNVALSLELTRLRGNTERVGLCPGSCCKCYFQVFPGVFSGLISTTRLRLHLVLTSGCSLWLLLQVLSDWDRFARGEYLRLAVEEEPDDMQVDAADDMWSNGRAAGSKMLLEDVDADDDLVPALGATDAGSGGVADSLPGDEPNGAAAMDASS